jgi:hypothetical protein
VLRSARHKYPAIANGVSIGAIRGP